MSSWGIVGEKQRGESFDSPPCLNSHAGTLLGLPYIKARTMRQKGTSSFFSKSLRFTGAPGPSTAVTAAKRRATKSVGYHPRSTL